MRYRDDGFTLVELLVALALVSLIATYMVSALGLAQRLKQAELRTELSVETDGARRHLKTVISNAQVFTAGLQQEQRVSSFVGRSDTLSITSALDDHLEVGGLYRLSYAVEARALLLTYRVFRFGEDTVPRKPLVLVNKVESVQFAYLDANGTWQDGWVDREDLPYAVEVRIAFPEGDERKWRPLVISLPMSR